jgi:hypothetical protein
MTTGFSVTFALFLVSLWVILLYRVVYFIKNKKRPNYPREIFPGYEYFGKSMLFILSHFFLAFLALFLTFLFFNPTFFNNTGKM